VGARGLLRLVGVDAPRDGVCDRRRARTRPLDGAGRIGEAWRDILGVWDDLCIEPEAYREIDGDRILVFITATGRGKTSGMAVEQMRAKGAHLLRLRDGKVVSLIFYWDRERALADLGLQE
jgi:hypothetical protein